VGGQKLEKAPLWGLFLFRQQMPVYTYKDIPQILAQVEKGRVVPVYLMAGDPYLLKDVHRQLIELLLPENLRSFNLERVDGEKEDLSSILERIQTFPFLPGRKVVSVQNALPIFSAGNADRLWKRAEEAWRKGQTDQCTRLLQSLFGQAGISPDWAAGKEQALMEKLFPGRQVPLPDWLGEALKRLPESGPGEGANLSVDQLLESAIRRGFPPDHVLIFLLEGPPGSKKMVRLIAEKGAVVDLSLKESKKGEQTAVLKGFIKSRFSREGKTIQPQAEAMLLERVGPEVFHLEMEIQKLLSYTGKRNQILAKDVMEIVGSSREEPLYELTAVLGERKLKEGLEKLKQLREQGYNPLQIMAGMTNALRRLLTAKELQQRLSEVPARSLRDFGAFSAKILPQLKQEPLPEALAKLHPFVLFNTLKGAANFSRPQLLSALEALHEADRQIKSSGGTPAFLLEDFIFSFCKKETTL
jgi:DNA polymerase-3 subunit delta